MSFKIHDKVNRIVSLSANLQSLLSDIKERTEALRRDTRALSLQQIHYMETEMEFGILIGLEYDHREAIEKMLAMISKTEEGTL